MDEPADVVVRGGTIVTFDKAMPDTMAVAMSGGEIVALGDDAESMIGPRTDVRDLGGGTATPGLVDAHAHLVGLGQSLEQVDLRGAASTGEVVARLREQAPPSGWIIGRGWDQNLWPGKAMPTHSPLTQAFPDRPVWLRRVDGHAGWGNRALMEAAGIGKRTQNPEGGEFLRDGRGFPTGVFVDAAMSVVPVPPAGPEEIERYIRNGQQHALERGLTGVHDMGVGATTDGIYRELAAKAGDGLRLRVHGYADQGWFARERSEGTVDPLGPHTRYALCGVKLYADGALGSRGAALLAPYSDRPGHTGLMQQSPEVLRRLVDDALAGGFQVATHAIGDAANRAVLDVYIAAMKEAGVRDARLRIEHAQIVSPQDIPRFAEHGIIASMQPTHATSDMPWVPDRIGPGRLAGAYAWRSFLEAGAHLCFGSDFPVELADVTHGLYAARTRQDADGNPAGGWLPEQRLSLEEALRAFSVEAAYAIHREDHLGKIAIGYRGDVTCFEGALMKMSNKEIREAKVLGTIVDGKVEHWA
jgi:predicted amidohydrolase YtcJ